VSQVLGASGCIGKTTLLLVEMTEGPAAGCTTITPWLFGRLDLQQQQQLIIIAITSIQPPITSPFSASVISCQNPKAPE